MLLELLASVILWTGIDQNTGAKLEVSCDKIEFIYGGEPTANEIIVSFKVKDKRYFHIYTYNVPMKVDSNGAILLEPVEYWIEEIKQQGELSIVVDKKIYNFDLTGTNKLINCNGRVVERNTQET